MYIVAIGEVRPEVAAAALFAAQRRARDQPADGDETCRAPCIAVERLVASNPRIQLAREGLESLQRSLDSRAVPKEADVAPHHGLDVCGQI